MNTKYFRKPLAGIILAGGLLVGGAGMASAETGQSGGTATATRATTEQRCQRAEHVHDDYQRLVALRDKEAAAGHTELAAKLTTRLEKLKARDQRVEARMVKLHDKVAAKCTTADVAPTPAP
jgi:hypothetical protein